VPARLINTKYITTRAEKVASPVTALQPVVLHRVLYSLKMSLTYQSFLFELMMIDKITVNTIDTLTPF